MSVDASDLSLDERQAVSKRQRALHKLHAEIGGDNLLKSLNVGDNPSWQNKQTGTHRSQHYTFSAAHPNRERARRACAIQMRVIQHVLHADFVYGGVEKHKEPNERPYHFHIVAWRWANNNVKIGNRLGARWQLASDGNNLLCELSCAAATVEDYTAQLDYPWKDEEHDPDKGEDDKMWWGPAYDSEPDFRADYDAFLVEKKIPHAKLTGAAAVRARAGAAGDSEPQASKKQQSTWEQGNGVYAAALAQESYEDACAYFEEHAARDWVLYHSKIVGYLDQKFTKPTYSTFHADDMRPAQEWLRATGPDGRRVVPDLDFGMRDLGVRRNYVIIGPPGRGKSMGAQTLVYCLPEAADPDFDPVIKVINQIEDLRCIARNTKLLVFDEVNFRALSAQDIVTIMSYDAPKTLKARYTNIVIPPLPRVFVVNSLAQLRPEAGADADELAAIDSRMHVMEAIANAYDGEPKRAPVRTLCPASPEFGHDGDDHVESPVSQRYGDDGTELASDL